VTTDEARGRLKAEIICTIAEFFGHPDEVDGIWVSDSEPWIVTIQDFSTGERRYSARKVGGRWEFKQIIRAAQVAHFGAKAVAKVARYAAETGAVIEDTPELRAIRGAGQ
jgi:hypothetical protein